jgi:hypothetical protein
MLLYAPIYIFLNEWFQKRRGLAMGLMYLYIHLLPASNMR